MRRTIQLCLAVLITLLLAGNAGAQPGTLVFRQFTVDVPSGWGGSVADGNAVLMPSHSKQGDVVIIISLAPSTALDQTITAGFSTLGDKVLDRSLRRQGKRAKDGAWRLELAGLRLDSGRGAVLVGATRNPGGQAVLIAMFASDKLRKKHEKTVIQILRSVDAASTASVAAKATPSPSTAEPDSGFRAPKAIAGLGKGLTGVWVGQVTSAAASASSTSGVDLSARWETYLLLADGTWTTRPPIEGLDHANIEALRARLPAFFGRYTLSGKDVRLQTSNGIVYTYRLRGREMQPTGSTSGSSFTRADTGVGLRIAGTYARRDITTRDFPGDSLPVLNLGRDGRFEDRKEGVRTVFSGSSPSFNASGKGRYFIANNSLYLIYDDHRKKMISFAVLVLDRNHSGSPSSLLVGDRWMTRR